MRTVTSLLLAAVAAFAVAESASAENTIYPLLKDNLVAAKGNKLEKVDDAALADKKYYAFYYSAAWCGPCRAFTPDLVKWYKRHKNKPQFELIFVSSDRSEEDMAKYIKDDDMAWPALAFDKKKSVPQITKYCGPGIPCLVMVDAEGKVVVDSYKGKEYLGPRKALEEIEKVLKKDPATASSSSATGPAKVGSSSFDDFFKKKPAAQ